VICFQFSHVAHHWLASQEGFCIKWHQDRQGSRNILHSCFYLAIHRRRVSKSGETSSKPLLFWRFLFKFSKNLRQKFPFQKTHFGEISPQRKNAAMEALRKKERQDEIQFTTNTGGNTSLGPSYFAL
jgi:hypothetical protein